MEEDTDIFPSLTPYTRVHTHTRPQSMHTLYTHTHMCAHTGKLVLGAGEMVQAIKNICPCREPGLDSQHSHEGSQALVPDGLTPSFAF